MNTTNYTTRIVDYGDSRKLEILADGKPWGERSPGQEDFELSVADAEAALLDMGNLVHFLDSKGLALSDEGIVMWLPDTPLVTFDGQEIRNERYEDVDFDVRVICTPYWEVRDGLSRKWYSLQKADALVDSEVAITRFLC